MQEKRLLSLWSQQPWVRLSYPSGNWTMSIPYPDKQGQGLQKPKALRKGEWGCGGRVPWTLLTEEMPEWKCPRDAVSMAYDPSAF